MARRHAGPWLRKSDLCWYTTHNGRVIKLGSQTDSPAIIQQRYKSIHSIIVTVGEIVKRFLDANRTNLSSNTYNWYATFLAHFIRTEANTPVCDITPSCLNSWIAADYGNKSANTRHAAARAVIRAINWAVQERIIDHSPLSGFRKPQPTRRESIITAAQYALCLRKAKPAMRDPIKFLWHAGPRPQEMRAVEAAWLSGCKLVFPLSASKGGRHRRVIYLNDIALAIIKRLSTDYPTGPIFRNKQWEPWSKDGLVRAFQRLRERTAIEGLCAYSFRHAWITRLLEKGVDVVTVAALSGNSPRMVLNVYAHATKNDETLTRLVS